MNKVQNFDHDATEKNIFLNMMKQDATKIKLNTVKLGQFKT